MIVNNEQNVNVSAAANPASVEPTVEQAAVEQPVLEAASEEVPVETQTPERQTVVEAPEVDFSNSTNTPPLPDNTAEEQSDTPQQEPTEPQKTFSNRKAYQWLYDLNSQAGDILSPDQLKNYARVGIDRRFGPIYRQLGLDLPSNDELTNIYNGFFDVQEAEVEKKNSVESDSTTTSQDVQPAASMDSESTSSDESYGSDSGFLSPDYSQHIPQYDDTTLPDLIKQSDVSWMTMSERDAELAFEQEYGRFGFKAEQTGKFSNELLITAPDGSVKKVRLYTEEKREVIDWVNAWQTGNTETGDYVMDIHVDGLRDWMTSKVENIGLVQLSIRNSGNAETTARFVYQGMQGQAMLDDEDEFFLVSVTGDPYIVDTMYSQYSDGTPYFDVDKAKGVLNDVYSRLGKLDAEEVSPINTFDPYDPDSPRTDWMGNNENAVGVSPGELQERIKVIGGKMNSRMDNFSKVVGGAIVSDPMQGHFNLANDDYQMTLLMAAGMSPEDMSFGENLMINGRPATYREAEHLLSDYDGIIAVNKRNIDIQINSDVQGSIAKQMLERLSYLQERNNAKPIPEVFVDGGDGWYHSLVQDVFDQMTIAKDKFVDLGQTLILATGDVFAHVAKASPVQGTSFGTGGFILVPKNMSGDDDYVDPADIMIQELQTVRNEWLPYYNTGISDANSFAEVLAKGGNATMESLPITALFLMNPEMGLAVTFANGYGQQMYNLEQRQKDAQAQLNENYFDFEWKTAEIEKLANMSRFETQAYAATMAGAETALTAAFTYRFFKGLAGSKNFAGAHTAANARTLANEYGKQFHKGYVAKVAAALGVSPKVLLYEVSEEEGIAASQYAIEVMWGLKEFDGQEFKSIMEETGYQSLFTASGIGALSVRVQNARINKAVDGFMRSNMTTNAEQQSLRNYILAQQKLNEMQQSNEKNGGPSNDVQAGEMSVNRTYTEKEIQEQQELVDGFGRELDVHKKKKDELLDQMTPEDKYEFLQAMEEVKRFAETVRDDEDANIAAEAVPKMNAAKDRARAVLAKYPSSVSFDYMGVENRAGYMERAVQSLIENEYAGKNVVANYDISDILSPAEESMAPEEGQESPQGTVIPVEEIIAKAQELYLMDVAEGKALGDGTQIIENTTAEDAYRERVIPREVREGFNVQDHIDQIREKENSKGMLADPNIAVEALPKDVQMNKQDRIDQLNAERQAAIDEVNARQSTEQEQDVTSIDEQIRILEEKRDAEVEEAFNNGMDEEGLVGIVEGYDGQIAELQEQKANQEKDSESPQGEFEPRSNSPISVETKVAPNGTTVTHINVTPSRGDFDNKSADENALNIALDIANEASSTGNTVLLYGGIQRLIEEGGMGYYGLSRLTDFLKRNDVSVDEVVSQFKGSESDLATLKELLEAHQAKKSSSQQDSKPVEGQAPKTVEEINAEYDAKIEAITGGVGKVVPVNEKGQVEDESVINENSFTHVTLRPEAIEAWANSGQVIGVGEDIDAFEERVGTTIEERFSMEGNRQSPNFQRGKIYGNGTNGAKGGFVIVSKSDAVTDEDVVPNRGFQNQDSFETSNGVGVIKPNKRGIENFDLYSVNEDGSLTKRDWDEFKTQEDPSAIGDANNTPRGNVETSREADALNRIEVLNAKEDVLKYFNDDQKDIIIGFMLDMKDGNKTRVGQVENLLAALDIVMEIKTQLGQNKIDIPTKEGNILVKNILNLSLNAYSGVYTKDIGTLSTTTVLMQSLFKDSKIGKAFLDLNNEAGRRVDATKQSNAKRMDEHLSAYQEDAKNDSDWQNASKKERKEMADPNHINNSYELSMLSMLRREMGQFTKEGVDVEFERNKNLILEELDIRRSNYEANQKLPPEEQNPMYGAQYMAYKAMVDKLGIADAKSYADVAVRASGRNVQAVQRFVDAQPNAEAMEYLHRYADFSPTELAVYLPSFYSYNEGQTYVDRIGFDGEMNRSNTAGQTKDATMPTRLVNDELGMSLRLAPGNYWNQMYGSLQGLELDLNARDQYRQITELMKMPQFQMLFEGNVMNDRGEVQLSDLYKRIADAFMMREDVFEKDIKASHFGGIDIGQVDPATGVWSSTVQAAYSTASALVLTGTTQNIRQYQSAVSGVMPLLVSQEARQALVASNMKFYVGMGHATSGVEGKTWAVRQMRNLLGSNDYASNIYAQSRTGLRNSLGSELIVDKNKKMPPSYYLRNWGLVDVKPGATQQEIEAAEQEAMQRFVNHGVFPDTKSKVLYTWKEMMDLVSASNNATLELLLANGDRAAANATFEALYIDYRIKQGAKYDKGFWERENANPNIEAINYADQKIDETQKQTTSTSQAGLYSDYSSQFANNLTKFVVPFGSFTFNTRSAIMQKVQVLQDPDIDPEQKQQARRFLEGKAREIGYFEGIKALGVVGLYQGIPGLAQMFGAIDEEDIERYGGVTELVGNKILPIEDRDLSKGDFVDLSRLNDVTPNEATSTEQYRAVNELVNSALQATEYNASQAAELLMTYENKLKINPYNINIAEKVTADMAKMMNPIPRPDLVDDGAKAMWNYCVTSFGMEELKVTEFLTQDFKSIQTKDGLFTAIMNNAGIIGILGQEYENLSRAITLANEGMIYKRNTLSAAGVTGVSVTSLNPQVRERLDQATNTLLYLRLTAALAPGVPKQDINKIADKVERQLEEIYDAINTDKTTFDPKDSGLNIKGNQEEVETSVMRNNILDDF